MVLLLLLSSPPPPPPPCEPALAVLPCDSSSSSSESDRERLPLSLGLSSLGGFLPPDVLGLDCSPPPKLNFGIKGSGGTSSSTRGSVDFEHSKTRIANVRIAPLHKLHTLFFWGYVSSAVDNFFVFFSFHVSFNCR